MNARSLTLSLCILGAGTGLGPAALADASMGASAEQLVASAMSAAPASVAQKAGIVTMEANGSMRTVREGTNGFTCMPDNPATPGPDPMCMDPNAMAWVHAWVAHQPVMSDTMMVAS